MKKKYASVIINGINPQQDMQWHIVCQAITVALISYKSQFR